MKKSILVAGATGHLGEKIIAALLSSGISVRAIVRQNSDIEKIKKLQQSGVTIIKANMLNLEEVTAACKDVACVISSLQGLHDVIVDTQKILLDAAVAAGVPRFIPSDFSVDFTKIKGGENRNFDLRREFHTYLDKASIAATSIFNGAFANILAYNIPILDYKKKTVGYWGHNPDYKLDFTTMDDTAAFTAAAALDSSTPRYLRIAGFQVSPNELVAIAEKATNSTFELINMGSVEAFAAYNNQERKAHPEGENQLNPRWQSGQYMHDMFVGQHSSLDNNRYYDLTWTNANSFICSIL